MDRGIENAYKHPNSSVEKPEYFSARPRDISPTELLFEFKGRVNRKQFWIVLGPVLIFHFIALTDLILFTVVFLTTLYPCLATLVKRYHDLGKSGWNCLYYFVPSVGVCLVLAEAGLSKGRKFDNKYGKSLFKPL